MKALLAVICAAIAFTATPVAAHDPRYSRYYDDYGWSDRGADYDVYSDWQPEFRNREQRYRHRYADDHDVTTYRYRRYERRNARRHYRGRDYEEEFWVGNCKVEREWDDGRYKEEVDCD